ncbi:unnamed protein product [Adineta ricciae]|uniref:Peptidase S1 domain-containing protein n=1 Tax=Adineta ricciae TaxID=249248 RepID=A0A814RVD2_ADIRI|nr:unnamed protein product [Adineta ricciae]
MIVSDYFDSYRVSSHHSLHLFENPYECDHATEKCGCSLNPPIFARIKRIVGGEQVIIRQSWPWMVSIRKWGHRICGGVLISSPFILIAVGIIQQSNLTRQYNRIRTVIKVYLHSDWNAERRHNDLAIPQLERPLDKRFSNKIRLPEKSDVVPVDSEVIAIGFSREKESSTRTSDVLR